MNEPNSNPMDRRVFLQAGVVATAATTGLVAGNAAGAGAQSRQWQARSCRSGSWATRVSR